MSISDSDITHKHIESGQVAYIRFNLREREGIRTRLGELSQIIPVEIIAGAPYANIQYFSSYTQGYEAEVGFPVTQPVENGQVRSKLSPALDVLSITHQGPPETLHETKIKLHQFTGQHALISDEFTREVYPDWDDPHGAVEVQFVIHNWNELLAHNLERVLGQDRRAAVMQGLASLDVDSTPTQRFEWVKIAMGRLDGLADEYEKYDLVSSCAHVYPSGQLDKLKVVYTEARNRYDDSLDAVDAVSAFMDDDPGWNEKEHYRTGRILFHTKNPADPQGYADARTDDEKRAAYCFCPVIRANLDKGMPVTYCYCGAGWYRQQWEAATGKPVRVEVVQSVLKGDLVCQFAVHLPEDL